ERSGGANCQVEERSATASDLSDHLVRRGVQFPGSWWRRGALGPMPACLGAIFSTGTIFRAPSFRLSPGERVGNCESKVRNHAVSVLAQQRRDNLRSGFKRRVDLRLVLAPGLGDLRLAATRSTHKFGNR